jgi:hypothetical protein
MDSDAGDELHPGVAGADGDRHRNRVRIGAVIGAVAVVAVVIAGVLIIGGDDPDTLVTTDETQVPASSVVDDEPETPEPTLAAAPAEAVQTVEVVDADARVGSRAGANGAPEYGEWMVPWEDGFLIGSMSFPPQRLPDELPDEVVALFPQEVVDLFDGDLPDSISEATDRLSEAGLLDVVTQIIGDNPQAYDAIYSMPSTTTLTLDVRFTTDGATWEPREMALPPDATYFSAATAVGDRLVVVYSTVDPVTGLPADGRVVVAATTDLTTWTTQDIILPSPPELPEGVTWSVFSQGLVANDNGWVVPVYSSVDIDAYSLVPEDVRAEFDESRGLSVGTNSEGITIESDFDDDGDDPAQSVSYTWDELGVAPEVAALLAEQDYTPTLWSSAWDGVPASADTPPAQGPMVATPAGFVMWTDQSWFSSDGVDWTASPLPGDAAWVSGAFAIDGGLIVLSATDDGGAVIHRVDERGGDAVALDVDGLPEGQLSSMSWMPGTATAAMVVGASPPVDPDDMLSVEVDGYRLTVNPMVGIFDVTDVATGETVVSAPLASAFTDDASPITLDDSGITASDPDTGEVLVVFPTEALDAAENEMFDAGGGEYTPDFWLLASLDGERFVVDDLDDANDGPMSVAANGSRLLVQVGRSWLSYDLT